MSKINVPVAENLSVKNAYYTKNSDMVIIYHYNTPILVETKKDKKIYLYKDKLTASDARAVRELYDIKRVSGGYTYYNPMSCETETAGLISELQ